MRDPTPVLLLVTGLPGTGKSKVADAAADALGAAVLAHDWAMSGLRPYPELQETLDALPMGHRRIGWSILTSLARAELRRGRTVILDGVARVRERDLCARVADEEDGRLLVVRTECSDGELHRGYVADRRREIPSWYELTWASVEQSARTWQPPAADLVLDAVRPWAENEARLRAFLMSPDV